MKLIAFAAVLLAPAAAWAQEWLPIDARSKGMGNVGTALAEGAAAGYWNPANLAKDATKEGEEFSFGISSFGATGSGYTDLTVEGETIAALDRIADLYEGLNFQIAQGNLNTAGGTDDAALQAAIQILDAMRALQEEGSGLYATGGGSIELKFGVFSLFHRENITAGGTPVFDFVNGIAFSSLNQAQFYGQITGGVLSAAGNNLVNSLVAGGFPAGQDADGDGTPDVQEVAFNAQQAMGDAVISDPGFQSTFVAAAVATNNGAAGGDPNATLYNNQSGFEYKGILMRETGFGIGIPLTLLPIPFLSTVNVGIAIKEVIGETFYGKVTLQQIQDGDDLVADLEKQWKETRTRTNQFSMDLGLSVSPLPWFTAGLSAKNIIPMKFESDAPGVEDIEVKPQVRAGFGFHPLGLLKIGMDIDLTENDLGDYVEGLKSRMGGVGAELTLPFVSLRTGMFSNLANVAQTGGVWTGGIGLNLFIFKIDVDGQIAFSDTEIEVPSPLNGTDRVHIPERLSFSFSVGLDLKF